MASIAQEPSHPVPGPAIRTARRDDAARVARPLALAFRDDPVFRWITPDDERRAQVLPRFFELVAEQVVRFGETYLAGDDAAALWVPPGEQAVAADDEAAFVTALVEVVGDDAGRLFEVIERLEHAQPEGTFWYLEFLGIAPALQGRGIGSAILDAMFARCDREGLPVYLDATSARNRAWYERHGFRVIGEVALTDGPTLWNMWREPRGTGAAGDARAQHVLRIDWPVAPYDPSARATCPTCGAAIPRQ